MKVLVSGGIDGVRVVDLARRLKNSKGGFYWHFQDRAELLAEMKQNWIDEFSQQIISEVTAQKGPLRDRLRGIARVVREKESGKLDLAFTGWAQTDPEVHDLIDQVTEMRIAFIKGLLAETGCKEPQLTARARLFVVYFSWSEVMFVRTDDGVAGEELDEILSIMSGVAEG